jgi:hypothetical protein
MISRFFDKQCLFCRKFLTQVPLLILQNRSSSLQYVSGEVCFDLFKRSVRVSEEKKAQLKYDNGSNHFTDTKLWSLMVRMISFLFITSRYMSSFHFDLEFLWNFVISVF